MYHIYIIYCTISFVNWVNFKSPETEQFQRFYKTAKKETVRSQKSKKAADDFPFLRRKLLYPPDKTANGSLLTILLRKKFRRYPPPAGRSRRGNGSQAGNQRLYTVPKDSSIQHPLSQIILRTKTDASPEQSPKASVFTLHRSQAVTYKLRFLFMQRLICSST